MSVRRAAAAVGLTPVLLVVLAGSAAAQGLQLDTAGSGTAAGLWLSRLVNHLSLAAAVGLLLVPAWLLRDGGPPELGRRATRLAALAAGLWALSGVGVLVFGVSNAAARPLPEAVTGELLSRFSATRFGTAVALQGGAALVVAGLAAASRNRAGARLALGGALLSALGPAWWGHAGTSTAPMLAIASTWVHIGAASLWVGGLLAVTVLVLGKGAGGDPAGPTARFSALAGWAVLGVALTGVVNTALQTSAPNQLLDTSWGRMALLKGALLVGLAGLGWAHRRRSLPRLRSLRGSPAARSAFLRLAAVELVVMLGAFGLATTMASGLPAEAEAAARIQTTTTVLGQGLVELTLDPAATGRNELHVYVYDDARALRPFADIALTFRNGDVEVVPRLVDSGPGHVTGFDVALPFPGTWTVDVVLTTAEGGQETATTALSVR